MQLDPRDTNLMARTLELKSELEKVRGELDNARAFVQAELQRADTLAVKAEAFDKLRDLCGYWQDGSFRQVAITQDDATKSFILYVGDHESRAYYGPTLVSAILAAHSGESP